MKIRIILLLITSSILYGSYDSRIEIIRSELSKFSGTVGEYIQIDQIKDNVIETRLNSDILLKYYKLEREGLDLTSVDGDEVYIDTNVFIDYDTAIYEDIVIVGNAQFIVKNCNFTLKGNLTLVQNTLFSVDSSNFNIPEDFIYQYLILSTDTSSISITNTVLNTSNFPISCGLAVNGSFYMENVDMTSSFITFSLMHNSNAEIINTDKAGEFVMFTSDSARLHITNSDSVLVWLGFPKYSSGEISNTPAWDQWVDSFTYPDSSCSGLYYTVEVESLYGLYIASMAEETTDVTVRDSKILAAGNIFMDSIQDTISGLVNYSYYSNFTAPFPDRTLNLINSELNAWNLYFFGAHNVTIKSSIFGECLTASNSKVLIMNSTCDGAGGHIGASDSTIFTAFMISVFTDVLLEINSTSIIINSNILQGHLIARDRAIAVLYNTTSANPFQVYDSAAILITAIYPPVPAYVDDTISIQGSAAIERAAISPFDYVGYRMEYAPTDDTSQFFTLCDLQTSQVLNNEICEFNTSGLSVGNYTLRMWYIFSAYTQTDSLNFDNWVELSANVGVEEIGIDSQSYFECRFFGDFIEINYELPKSDFVTISLFNIAGQKVEDIYSAIKGVGRHQMRWRTEDIPSGQYFVGYSVGSEMYGFKKVMILR